MWGLQNVVTCLHSPWFNINTHKSFVRYPPSKIDILLQTFSKIDTNLKLKCFKIITVVECDSEFKASMQAILYCRRHSRFICRVTSALEACVMLELEARQVKVVSTFFGAIFQ